MKNKLEKNSGESNKSVNTSDVKERVIKYLNGRIRLIRSKYEIDECDERIIDVIEDIIMDIKNEHF